MVNYTRTGVFLGAGVALGAAGTVRARQILRNQAERARQVIGVPEGDPPNADKTYRNRYKKNGPRIELLVLGDSIAAGLGAEDRRGTLGARLAKGLAKRTKRRVRLRTLAVVGSESKDLADQIARIPLNYSPDVCVIIIGGNDVTHRVPINEAVAHLENAIIDVHATGAEVVVGLCPDLGALRPVPQPLRTLAARESRKLAKAQREVVLRQGARAVSLATVVGSFFISDPDGMFSFDRFHPSSLGYRRTARAMMPSLLHALGKHEGTLPEGHHVPVASS